MTLEMATKDSVDSLPPVYRLVYLRGGTNSTDLAIFTFQYRCIARLDSKRSDVGNDLRAGLKDDEQHADRTRNSCQFQAIIKLRP